MAEHDFRIQYVVSRIKDFVLVGDVNGTSGDELATEMTCLTESMTDENQVLMSFLQGTKPDYLIFTYQPDAGGEKMKFSVLDPTKQDPNKPFVLRRRAVYACRNPGKAIGNQSQLAAVQEIMMGTLEANVVTSFEKMINDVYCPLLSKMGRWGKNSDSDRQEFISNVSKYADHIERLRKSTDESVTLQKVNSQDMKMINPQSKARVATDKKTLNSVHATVESWLVNMEHVIADAPQYGDEKLEDETVGPLTEVEIWKKRLAKLNLLEEQLIAVDANKVIAFLRESKSTLVQRWAAVDVQLSEKLAEAKENVKYLTSLEKFLTVVETGTPQTITNLLPALIGNVKMLYTIARHYAKRDCMTALFFKITNAMIQRCKVTVLQNKAPSRIWELSQSPETLREILINLEASKELNKAYKEEYHRAKESLAQKKINRDRQFDYEDKLFDFTELKLFGHFDLFAKRVDKLQKVFQTVEQFQRLRLYNIDQMGGLIQRFNDHLSQLKGKCNNILDIHDGTQFDSAYKQFDSHMVELETSLQVTINSSFENITSTENALNLLKKFQTILQTDSFRSDLDSKYMVIFHNYGLELENDQKLYERHKTDPPLVRNITPVAGAITWARQLLRHIKGPMDKFASNETVMNNPKESKKIIRTYNKVSMALVEYEAIWVDAWKRSIESSKAGLNATLLVRNEEGKLFVNFDLEIVQLIRETRAIMRMGGIEIPRAAKTVLMQEQKLKTFLNELTFLVKEYERVVGRGGDGSTSKIIPVTRRILQPNIDALDAAIRPGEKTLTWTSMNIDTYLTKVHKSIAKLDSVVTKVNDIVTNRIQSNLKMVSSTLLVKLNDDQFTLDQFVQTQDKHIMAQSQVMDVKNCEVQTAVDDVIATVLANQEPGHGETSQDAISQLRVHFNRLMFKAILTTTTRSLNLIKKRVGTRNRIAFMYVDKPFFDVNVQLLNHEPYVNLNPSLEEVQKAINISATAVLSCSKTLTPWQGLGDEHRSFFEEIAKNKEIVKVVLLLTGGIHGLKKQVNDYLTNFKKFEYLWKKNKEEEYEVFLARNPSLEDFEAKLSKFVNIVDKDLEETTPMYNIGSLSLTTEPLKQELRKKAEEWKEMYAKNLHAQALRQLDSIVQQMEEDDHQLNQPIPDQEKLEELRVMMTTLKSVRERESEIDFVIEPVREMYSLLERFKVEVPKDETDRVGELSYRWQKLRRTAEKRTDEINHLQHSFKKGLTQEVQKFGTDVILFRTDYDANGPMVQGINPQEAIERLKRYQRQFEDKERKWNTYMAGEELFGLPQHKYPELAKTKKELELLHKLYGLYKSVLRDVNGYNELYWEGLDFDKIAEEVAVYEGQCKRLPGALRGWDAFKELKETLENFMKLAPMIKALKEDAVKDRHWKDIMKICDKSWSIAPTDFKLIDIVNANMTGEAIQADVIDIAGSAVREADIEKKYAGLLEEWKEKTLVFKEFKHKGPISLNTDETNVLKDALEEAALAVNSMLSSRYCDFKREDVRGLLNKLVTVGEKLALWLEVQNLWSYLEAVFSGGDIAKQMPNETKAFHQQDKSWVKIMTKANEQPNVLDFCYENELLDNLVTVKDNLENIQRKLADYLETKRNSFPRFYFVSDTVLLEILSQASDPESIQPHLNSIFDGVTSVRFERVKPKDGQPLYQQIVELFADGDCTGESLPLVDPVPCPSTVNVETWLNKLCTHMCYSVKEVVRNATAEVELVSQKVDHLKTIVDTMPAQVGLLVLQLLWTQQVSDYIQSRTKGAKVSSVETSRKIEGIKSYLVRLTTSPELDQKPMRFRTNVETLITVQVHQEEVWLNPLKTVSSMTSFDWLRQARFYFKPEKDNGNVVIQIADSDTDYCNEYLGVKERLVITPLTDRCYITLSQALAMYMGGAPAGPAGTGKTETTKDLARTFGKLCVVFNCSDQLDRDATGKIIRGLSQANAWGCFDEFNRIDLPVLSVVAQQISCVLQALKQHKSEFTFIDGQNTVLKPGVGFFITMNPGYAGRQELPENLKILFRGVTMMVPDRCAIMKVKLASQGYQTNDILSKKFFFLYQLCEEQLSKQRHYDFGLRNILSVLRTAGAVLRKNLGKPEDFLFMRTLRDMNLSKLVIEDIDLFDALLRDMFPGLVPDKMSHGDIENEIKILIEKKGLVNWEPWYGKIIQLYETKLVRHGVMMVGPALVGKTQCYDIMTEALSVLHAPHIQLRMNPKAITAQQMFGRLVDKDWHDGIFSALWRRAVRDSKKKHNWIVCDGPVDAIWIENLNTVLDDNKLLTLANGDRIFMAENMKMCFEVENLSNASPATVSRAGIIYISETILGWRTVLTSRLKAKKSADGFIAPADVIYPCNQTLAAKLLTLFLPKSDPNTCKPEARDDSLTQKIADFYNKECKLIMRTTTAHLVINAFHLCVSFGEELQDTPLTDELTQMIYWFSIAWAFGGLLEPEERMKFDGFIRTLYKKLPPLEQGTIFDHKLDLKTAEWTHWNKSLSEWVYPGNDKLDFNTLFIPTLDSTRLHYLIDANVSQRKPLMLMGVSGTAKTVTLEKFLLERARKNDKLNSKKINFSSLTTPHNFYTAIDDLVEKMGPSYGPKGGGELTLFVDDINMPEINEWNDQVTNEIVRQVIEMVEYYSFEKGQAGNTKKLKDIQYVAAMSHPTGGKNDIPSRLKRHFTIFNVPLPDEVSIKQMFGSIFSARFKSGYHPSVLPVANKITGMTIDFWKKIGKKMLPTPAKFHYFFNLRDLAAVCQGMCQVGMWMDPQRPEKRAVSNPADVITDASVLMQSWYHECTRVFSDKLNTKEDKIWFDREVREVAKWHLKDVNPEVVDVKTCYFVNYLRDPIIDPETDEVVEDAPKIVEPSQSIEQLQARLYASMTAHNDTPIGRVRKLDLVLFDAAVKHVGRVVRTLNTPRGNLLMVGVGGSGKQSLTRLATFVSGYDYAAIQISKGFGVNQLFDAIREQYLMAAFKQPVTFVFTDNEIKQELFLEYINSFLSNGEIPGLFPADQRDAAINDVRPIGKKDPMFDRVANPFVETPDFLWKYFINRVRDRLHMVLCFSPVGEKFRTRARKFPALVSSCVINWFFPWPHEALLSVSDRTLSSFKMEADDETKKRLKELMASIHRLMAEQAIEYKMRFRRDVYSTPKSYLSFIQSYVNVYNKKHSAVNEEAEKINGGLDKLNKAGEDVRKMRTELAAQEVVLARARTTSEALVLEIEVRVAAANEKQKEVEIVKNKVAADAAVVSKGEAEATRDLEAAEPALLMAVSALNSVTASDFTTLKKLQSPPPLIKRIFDGVAILLHGSLGLPGAEIVKGKLWITDSWDVSGKQLAGDAKTLQVLQQFGIHKKDYINEETCELLLPYLWMDDFTRERAASACGNVAGLCTWVSAMYTYISIAKVVGPKKEKLRLMQNELRVANRIKGAQEEELAKVAAEVDAFNKQFELENAKKVALEEKAEATKNKMESATNLIEALSGERERWNLQRNEFKDIIRRMVGDVALSCAFISYCGPFNSEFRHQLLYTHFNSKCKSLKIPMTENMSVVKFLADETTIADWQLEGLPADDHSVQNAIMITSSSKWPLLIDPQGQALSWLIRRCDKFGSKLTQMKDKHFIPNLQQQMQDGKPLIVENVTSEIDPVIDPVLEKQVVKQRVGLGIKINDQDMSYDENFTFFMTTKLPNPSFTPEMFAKCLVIDFTVTQSGLEQQLLSHVVSKEKAELNEENARLTEEINTNEKKRKDLEDELLARLANSEGDLIEDVTLIETLANTNLTSKEIKEKLEVAMETKKRIVTACEEYRPVATQGSVLYFLIVECSHINPMYQTSLPQFQQIFDNSIDQAERPQLTAKRIQAVIDLVTWKTFQDIVRGLFTQHKLLFVLLMACKIEMKAKRLDPTSFDVFLKGQAAVAAGSTERVGPFSKWMKEKSWNNLLAVTEQAPKSFKSITEIITRNEQQWKAWYEKEALEQEPVPDLNEKLDPFDRMLLIRALREDRTMLAATRYVANTLGKPFAESHQLDITSVIEETKGTVPVIFLLSQGSDPTTTIEAAAKKLKKRVNSISMGQGQEKPARMIVSQCWQNGEWALLQNCHLGLPFLDQLEEMLREVIGDPARAAAVHEESRVWITAEPAPAFPIGLLQMSVKLTNEPPQGIRAGVIRSYSWLSQDSLETFRRPEWRPLLFTQCVLHSIVQERRKFGAMGFCVPYEFNQGDWHASVQYLINHLTLIGEDTKKGQVSWETIQYMVADIQYGGRITDNKDRKLFAEIVKMFHPKICEPNHTYARGATYRYGIPQFEEYKRHIDFVREEYPDVDPPDVFGMSPNADITYRTRQAQLALTTILDVQPRGVSNTGSLSREDKVLQATERFVQDLPANWNPDKKERLNKEPLSIFCAQEIDRLIVTLRVIRQTCLDLKLAVAGTIIMSPKLTTALDFIGDGRVPPDWAAVSWPFPITLANWFPEVKRRYEMMDSWARNGRPMYYWFNGFFNPQGFLTSVRQEITRSPRQGVTWALDKVETRTEVRIQEYKGVNTEKEADPPEAKGVFIYGLCLDGASWSKQNRKLMEAAPGELTKELPILCVYAALIGDNAAEKKDPKKVGGKYRCPVYKYPSRTDNFWIFDVDLNSDLPDADHHWRMRGVALLCSTD